MILKKAIEVWGEQSQFIKTTEELGELIAAISKYLNYDVEGRHDITVLVDNIVDEVADVEIMLYQVKEILGIRVDVSHQKNLKLKRLEEILK